MKLGLVCADVGLRQLAVKRISDLPQFELEWYCADVAEVARQPAVALLLVAAGQCSRALLSQQAANAVTVIALVRQLAVDCDALYAALDAGAPGYIEIETLSGPALAERLLRLNRQQQPARSQCPPLIALGASAGGPAALKTVLSALPADLPAAVLVVQHFEGERIERLCEWLALGVALKIRPALDGQLPEAGVVHVADSGRHLELDLDGRIRLAPRRAGDLYCPSVDRLFHSLVMQSRTGTAAVLTGMGQDGAEGLLALRRAGWLTLTQDAESSTVDGMPKAARELDAASRVVPLARLASALLQALGLERQR